MTAIQTARDAVLDELAGTLDDKAWDIPCDDKPYSGCDQPAEWVLHRYKCCPRAQSILMACTEHKNKIMTKEPPMWCHLCGFPFFSLSAAITRIEPLIRRPA